MVKPKRRGLMATLVLMTLGAWLAHAQSPGGARLVPPTSPEPAKGGSPTIATIGGRPITLEELNAREGQAFQEYQARVGQAVPAEVRPVVRRQLLENLIRRELLVLEAQRRGITVTESEAQAQLMQEPFFNPDGRFDPQRFEAVKVTQPDNFARAMERSREQIAARKLNERLEREYGPNESELRAAARRDLSTATLRFLALRRSEFDGSYREPREAEVLAEYRRGDVAYRRTESAHLTILVVDQPPLPEGVAVDGAEGRAWTARMRARADSALAAARSGSSFESLASTVGSVRNDVEVTRDNFPGYWQGESRDAAAIFSARPGALLGAPVASNRGWMVVRVERLQAPGVRPLAEVAREIRGALRTEARLHGEDRELRASFERQKGRFATTAYRIRYALFDTASVSLPEPTNAELDRWHRAHQADFSSFDAASGTIRVLPLSEVRDVVITRWKGERRAQSARGSAVQLVAAWEKRQRPRPVEQAAVFVREAGPVVKGVPVDATDEGRALAGELDRVGYRVGAGLFAYAGGWFVYQVTDSVPNFDPPFEQVRPSLAEERSRRLRAEEEAGARALFDADPTQFALRNLIYYSRSVVPPPSPLEVPLSRRQVEKYYRDHLDRYSTAEQVRARQIMIVPKGPSPEADAEARARAEALRDRIGRGEDFATLAREYSEDVATRDKGGDLGDFGRGTMLAAFEEVAFALQPGEVSRAFRTEVGYHIVQSVSYQPLESRELRYIYPNVGWDAALEMSDSIAIRRADSLAAAARTPAAMLKAVTALGYLPNTMFHVVGDRRGGAEFNSFQIRLENTKPGQLVPGRGFDRSAGHFVAWVDSIVPARSQEWSEARPLAIEAYRRGASQRALTAKRAELDSLLAQGWSMDSLATMFGGWESVTQLTPGTGLSGLGGSEVVDSLVFGTVRQPPVLAPGQGSDWLDLPGGLARLALVERRSPAAAQVAAQVENEGRIRLEHELSTYFDGLRKRYPVRILDSKLRDTPLPPPPAPRRR